MIIARLVVSDFKSVTDAPDSLNILRFCRAFFNLFPYLLDMYRHGSYITD